MKSLGTARTYPILVPGGEVEDYAVEGDFPNFTTNDLLAQEWGIVVGHEFKPCDGLLSPAVVERIDQA
ncbi:MAG: hypothetical protein AB1644_07475 [Candidatus Zixiibacteriota bacterium]